MKRVVFTFDDEVYRQVNLLCGKRGYGKMADAVQAALSVTLGLQRQAEEGFSEVLVRNPDTGEIRRATGPALGGQGR